MLDKWFAAAGAAAWGGVAFRRLLPFLSTGAREKVETLCPAPETVLVAAFPYYAGERPGNLSLYARGEDYRRVVTRRLNTVFDALRRKYPGESFVPAADNSPLPEREAAWLAGIGLRGKNGLLILPPYGTYVFLGTILTGAALDVPERPAAPDCPGCGACRAACPAGALGEGGADVSRCLSELTQKKGALTEEETARLRVHPLIWGCDFCQRACPYNAAPAHSDLIRIDCISGETEFLRSMDSKLNERIWGAFGDKILVYQYIDDNTIGLVSWDLNDTSNDEVLFTWKMNDPYPILGDGVLSYVGDDGYFHLMDLQSKEDIPLSQYSIPTSDISNISVTPLFADNGHLLIRELNGSECTYFALDTSGDIQTFDLLYDVDGDSEIFYPITSVDEDHYLVCAGFAVQNEVSALDDGSSTVLPVPDLLYAIINKDDYWHSITNYQSFE